jgi:FlaA1/EpsC-like NDP-sugar epimerase
MYNNLWKYANIDEILRMFIATTVVFVLLYVFDAFFVRPLHIIDLSRRLLFIAWMLDSIMFAFSRFGYRAIQHVLLIFGHLLSSKAGARRVMIIGAGFSGYGVVRGLLTSKIRDRIPVIVLDDDNSKNNTLILGVRVLYGTDRIEELAQKFRIDEIVIAMPQATNNQLRHILEQCTRTNCSLKIQPPISDVSDGKFKPIIRDVSIADLLYREEIKLDTKNISNYISNRVVMVTGGGGSIGSELCRQIVDFNPRMIIIFDFYENTAYELITELEARFPGKKNIFRVQIGSVLDPDRVSEVMETYHPNVIFHAAAHKHVHFMQDSPNEAVKNNVFGTLNLARCADKYKVERFVLLSTDKAVNPPNVYGVTKRIGELIMLRMAQSSGTKFMTVRFGNVLGSNGSIIPKFKWQIENGGPVTVTHKDAERFFMTIPEACALVLQAAGMGKSGLIYVLNMGTPVRIDELARNLIRLSGFRPDVDIKIVYTGLRPGEKLREELMMDEEKNGMQVTCHKKIFVAKTTPIDADIFDDNLELLRRACYGRAGLDGLDEALKRIEPHYAGLDSCSEVSS